MGQPSFEASNAIIYLTYGAFLVLGTAIAWKLRGQAKTDFLSSNGTQTAWPLALNFIASALGSGVLTTYPEVATLTGVQGMLIYAFSSALPMLIFGALGPIIRRQCPEGFVLTEWVRQRYGTLAMLWLSFMTLVTLFLYMISELSAIGQIVTLLTGLDGLPVMIVQCVVTTIYTSLGGFKISFLTDTVQGSMVVGLIIVGTIAVGVNVKIQPGLVEESGYLEASLVGWQLLYILPVAIFTNDFFLSQFWLRTFSSKTDKDLWIGVSVATVTLLCILTLVGSSGLIATWSGAWPGDPPQLGSVAFFTLLEQLPNWVVGVVLVMTVSLSTAAFDSFQSAMVSSASNDLFRNKINIWFIRALVVLIIFPVVAIAIKAPSVLQIYLISDLVSASTVPVLLLGLSSRFYWWRGFEVIVGGVGGLLTVFIFGTIYYGSAQAGGELLLVQQGLYSGDWGAFGAFVAAPVGSFIWAFAALGLRLTYQFVRSKMTGHPFTALDPPAQVSARDEDPVEYASQNEVVPTKSPGKFF
ncbi:unnamed protein product [Clonostachys rosea]|uniref:Urea transporter n=1 Tax=Bionectria ochroleuca TaxID=29856 RepID=A0ABY6UPQ1_BIOOC|nr:unnamed protein product [Clonostachys rosea]